MIFGLIITATQAASNCAPRADIVAGLASRYDERQVGVGLGPNGNLIEVWASAGGSFTILVSSPSGLSCMASSGHGYTTRPVEPGGEDM